MPIAITGGRFEQFISGIEAKLDSSDLIVELGNRLSEQLRLGFSASGLTPRSGASIRALEYVGQPERITNGWRIGVGNADALGDESQPAPRGVLRAFFSDNKLKPTPWRGIPPDYKVKLEAMRRAGMYGGRGQNYANYLWVQNRGNMGVYISARNFIGPAIERWREDARYLIEEYLHAQA